MQGREAERRSNRYIPDSVKSSGSPAPLVVTTHGAGQTAMVGDQIFTDILGARRMGILALLVEPIRLAGNPGRYLRYAVEWPFRALTKRRTKPL